MALATRGGFSLGAEGSLSGSSIQSRGGGPGSLAQKSGLLHSTGSRSSGGPALTRGKLGLRHAQTVSAALLELETRSTLTVPSGKSLPRHGPTLLEVDPRALDNRQLDKLVAQLGLSKATWRRALMLHEWLQSVGHQPDARLCTTLMRVCQQHGQITSALALYEWMRSPCDQGGAGLTATVFTYTIAMRAALGANMVDKALEVWDDAVASGCQPDNRMCTTLIEVASRKGDTVRALQMYDVLRRQVPPQGAPRQDPLLLPSVHAYTAAMRAADEGGLWVKALQIWDDMLAAGVRPTGHAYAAGISACATGGDWARALQLFDCMIESNIGADVVSCTALISALGADGQWQRAERVVEWMVRANIRPNVRTYTALVTALANAQQWGRAEAVVARMKRSGGAAGEPNSYTYSALLKAMGQHGQWLMAEQLFLELEAETLFRMGLLEAPPMQPGTWARSCTPVDANTQPNSTNNNNTNAWVVQSHEGLAAASLAGESWSTLVAGASPSSAPCPVPSPARSSTTQHQPAAGSPTNYSAVPLAAAELVLRSLDEEDVAVDFPEASTASRVGGVDGKRSTLAAEPLSPSSLLSPSSPSSPSSLPLTARPTVAIVSDSGACRLGLELRSSELRTRAHGRSTTRNRGPVNEVVCGALMAAYERAGLSAKVLDVLRRAQRLGVQPNTVMYNIAMSALGKSGQWQAAARLFAMVPEPDAVTHETMVAAYGMAGRVAEAEAAFAALQAAGHAPRDYAFCGLMAAYSMSGDVKGALHVATRLRASGVPMTVHVYNGLIAACERAQLWDKALALQQEMEAEHVAPNPATRELLAEVGRKGAAAVEDQQLATTMLSAVAAAAGGLLIKAGVF